MTEPEVLAYFASSGEPAVTAVFVYLNEWGSEPQVNWFGTHEDVSTPELAAQVAMKHRYVLNPTEKEYAIALKNLEAKILGAESQLLSLTQTTLQEVVLWSREANQEAFR